MTTPTQTLTPVRSSMLVFGQPDIQTDEIDEVVATLRSRWIGTGPKTAQFEREFAEYVGVESAVAVSSCTSALMLALIASGVGSGDEVITTPLTFCATTNAILHAGAVPVLADVDPRTMNIDPASIEAQITEKTKALVIVHFAGRACAMDEILAIVRRHDLLLIEDCAHAIETTYKGQHAGTFGDFGCFSFYATKNVCTAEGGMVVSRSPELAARIKTLALHGLSRDAWKRFGDDGYEHYQVTEAGFKCNMTDLQSSLGIHQLRRVDEAWQLREDVWRRYDTAFGELPLELPASPFGSDRHALHLYTVLVDKDRCGLSRDEFLRAMTVQNIGVGVHYVSLPEHEFYRQHLGWSPDDCPHAARIGRQTVSLPLSPALTYDDVEDVVVAVRRALGAAS